MEVQSQFIEMFDFHELNFNSPSKDFESMCLDDTSSATKIPATEYLQEGKYAVYDQAQEKDIAGYSNTEQGLCRNYPAVLFGDHSRVVKYINEPFFIGADGVKIIRPREDKLIPEFLYYDLKYHNIPNTGYNRHFKYIKMISLTKASLEEQSQFLSIAHQADKSKFVGFKSQFIEMFGDPMANTKGWSDYSQIGNYAQIVLGSTPNSKNHDYWDGEIKWITPAEMTEESYYIYDTERHLTEAGLNSANLTLLPYRSVLFSTRAPIGKVGLVGSPMYCNQGFKNFICGEKLNPVYLYYSLIFKREYLVSLGTGTTFKELSKKAVENLMIAAPPIAMQNEFETIYQQADKSKYYIQVA